MVTDHKRGCQGREYTCTCGYDDQQEAEIQRLRSELAKANYGARIATELLAEAVKDYNDALAKLAQARKTESKDNE